MGLLTVHPLAKGALVPSIAVPDQAGRNHDLADYRGKRVVLFFYPKDNTTG